LSDVQNGLKKGDEVSRRPNSLGEECPGCVAIFEDPNDRFVVPKELQHHVDKGVNGHSVLSFNKLAIHYKLKTNDKGVQHQCPKNNGFEYHALVPLCPHPTQRKDPHYLFLLNEQFFVCGEHPEARFWTCSNCNYPMPAHQGQQNCPRCANKVYPCHYCSETHLRYYVANDGDGVCPHCQNGMMSHLSTGCRDHDSEYAGFCSNIYACRAGSDLKKATTSFELGLCNACPSPQGQVFLRTRLPEILRDCLMCGLVLDSEPLNVWDEHKVMDEVKSRFLGKTEKELAKPCPICTASPGVLLRWLFRDDPPLGYRMEDWSENDGEWSSLKNVLELIEENRLPVWSFFQGVRILKTLRERLDDEGAFRHIFGKVILDYGQVNGSRLIDLLAVFQSGSLTRARLKKRLDILRKRIEARRGNKKPELQSF